MKKIPLKLAALFVFAAAHHLSAQALHPEQWKLVWSDEFDYQGPPDPAKWIYEEGMLRNHEAQYYTRERLENARVENGMLVIEARKEQFKNPKYNPASTKWNEKQEFSGYTSASLTTYNQASWTYGRIEVRAKLPHGSGAWPAIWTLGANKAQAGWPLCGEIDIMELFGSHPDSVEAHAHFSSNGKHKAEGRGLKVTDLSGDFHVFAIEWFADRIDFYYDKTKYYTFKVDDAGQGDDNPYRKPHFLLINFALGAASGRINDSLMPQKYLVDYVRVYEAVAGPQQTPTDGKK